MNSEDLRAEDHIGLVYTVSNKWRRSIPDDDERDSAAMLGLARAIRGFDPSLGFRFSTYAVQCMVNELRAVYKARRAKMRDPSRIEFRFLETTEGRMRSTFDHVDVGGFEQWVDSEHRRETIERLLSHLSDTERRAVEMRFGLRRSQSMRRHGQRVGSGASLADISRHLGMSGNGAYGAIERGIAKMQEAAKKQETQSA